MFGVNVILCGPQIRPRTWAVCKYHSDCNLLLFFRAEIGKRKSEAIFAVRVLQRGATSDVAEK